MSVPEWANGMVPEKCHELIAILTASSKNFAPRKDRHEPQLLSFQTSPFIFKLHSSNFS